MAEDLMEDRRCTAKSKQSGERCKRAAIVGGTVCAIHGGKSPAVAAAAERRAAEAKAQVELAKGLAAAYGDDVPDIDPAEAMLQAVSWKHAEVVALRAKVGLLSDDERVWGTTKVKTGGDDQGTTEEARPNIWWAMLHTAEEQLVKFAKAARDAGCDERRVALAERHGVMLAGVVMRILDALLQGQYLDAAGREFANSVAAREFRAIESGGGQ